MKDNKTLIMLSAVKNINQSFKFDISTKKLQKYSTKGKLFYNFINYKRLWFFKHE
ncbi:MAG: hypothetical protein Ct9H300mP5_1670 [Candidatus Pelagibacterales bacterium]|nr:MAG: hypothetical protein Ct9H300mP5_1670 [Pelagibacterales bacterium]